MDFWDFVQGVGTIVLTSAILAGLAALNAGRKSAWQAGLDCEIRPNRTVILGLGLGGALLAAGMAYGAYYGYTTFRYTQAYWLTPASFVFALMTWALVAHVIFPVYTVSWDSQRLRGPGSYWFPPFGPGRSTIAFDDIVEAGVDWGDSYFVRDAEGRQVKFSYLYKGYPQLMTAIAEARPDLFPDGEDDWDEWDD